MFTNLHQNQIMKMAASFALIENFLNIFNLMSCKNNLFVYFLNFHLHILGINILSHKTLDHQSLAQDFDRKINRSEKNNFI